MSQGRPNPIDVYVGHKIRVRRRIMGFSQERLAADIGLTFQQVQKYERGTNRVSASKLLEIALVLKTTPAYFFVGLASIGPAEPSPNAGADADIEDFLMTAEGIELARLFPRISRPHVRRRVLDLVRSMIDVEASA